MNPKNPNEREQQRMRNAITLLRVSTDSQDLARQRDEITDVVAEHSLSTARTLELHGISGTAVLDNKQIQQVLRDLEDPAIHGLACSALDRIFRPKDFGQMRILDYFAKNHKMIWTARDGELDPSTDAGWELCMQLATRAGAEIRELRRRSVRGKLKNARKGFRNSGSAPYGYRHDYRDQRTGKRASLVIYEPEAEVVRKIFIWSASGLGVMAIARELNLAGIKTQRAGQINPRTKEINSGKWDHTTIYQVLTNRTYSGVTEYPKGSPNAVLSPNPAIIDETLWGTVQLQLSSGREERSGRPSTTRQYRLTGLIWCLCCGHRVTTFPKNFGKASYRCGNIDRKPPAKRLCDARGFDKDYLENTLCQNAWATWTDPIRLRAALEFAYSDIDSAAAAAKIAQAKAALAHAQGVEERAYMNLKDTDLPRERTKPDWEQARQAVREAEFQLGQLQQEAKMREKPTSEQIDALVRDIIANPPQTPEDWRGFMRLFVKEIRLSEEEAHMECIIPEHLLPGPKNQGSDEKGKQNTLCCVYSNNCSVSPFVPPTANRPISFSINVKLTKSA